MFLEKLLEPETFSMIVSAGTGAATFIGVGAAVIALWEYKLTNRMSRMAQLHEKEQNIFQQVVGKEYLKAFFAYHESKHNPKTLADAQLAIIMQGKGSPPEWQTIQDLDECIYSAEHFYDEGLENLREAYALAESMLYVAYEAHDSKTRGVLRADQVSSFRAWVDNNGSHPLFLLAVYFWHHCGYFSSSFAVELREQLLASPVAKAIIQEVYPELLSADWPNQVGQERLYFNKCGKRSLAAV